MELFRLVTPKNIQQRADQAFIATAITGEPIEQYIESKNLRFSDPSLRNALTERVLTIKVNMEKDLNQIIHKSSPRLTVVK